MEVFSTAATMAFTSSGMSALVNGTSAGGSGTGGVSSSAMTAPVNRRLEKIFTVFQHTSSVKAH